MSPKVEELITLLSLERLEENLFRGQSHNIGTNRVYGGQVLGQAIKAAEHTVSDRHVHSIHAYFLRTGDHHAPIIYEVDRSRDGKSFSARRVIAIQHGKPIFTLSASFHIRELGGIEYQMSMPQAASPQTLKDIKEYLGDLDKTTPNKFNLMTNIFAAFDFKPVEPLDLEHPYKRDPERHMWLKTADKLPNGSDLHSTILAYISDFSLLDTNLLPHGIHILDQHIQFASIDHSIWFHREFKIDEWLLYHCEGISTSGSRGVARGHFYNEQGSLVASTMQEGLIRLKGETES